MERLEYQKKYRVENKERLRKYRQCYYLKHLVKERESNLEYYYQNRDSRIAYQKKYNESYKEIRLSTNNQFKQNGKSLE